MLRLAPLRPVGVPLPSMLSSSKTPLSSFTLLGFLPCCELILLISSPGSWPSWPFCGRGLPRNGVDDPKPPRPENMRPNSLLMPGSLPVMYGGACAPWTACGSGEARPVLRLSSRPRPICDLECCMGSPYIDRPGYEFPPEEKDRASGSVR